MLLLLLLVLVVPLLVVTLVHLEGTNQKVSSLDIVQRVARFLRQVGVDGPCEPRPP